MKTIYSYLLIALLTVNALSGLAQTDPGTSNLTHQWTFDNGLATDEVGGVGGTLVGAATITNKALNTTTGGYLSFSGYDLAVNTYSALTTELWFKSVSGQNSGNPMLSYFGDANVGGSLGTNYIFTSPSNGGNCRLAISTGNTTTPWTTENGVNRPAGAIDDGVLHHLVSVITSSSLTLYVDGQQVGTTALNGTNKLSSVSTATAYLCKSGYSSDPTWKGYVNKYSIYNKALSSDEVLYLYQQGAESPTSIDASKSSFSFDEINASASFTVTGTNLTEDITIEAPAGITASPLTLAANASNTPVTITYDKTTVVEGNITLTSGSTVLYIPVKASLNSACFTPLYPDLQNLVTTPYMNTISSSWGNVSLVSGAEVYCGSRSVKISGSSTCAGSVDTKSITWLPNTTYRLHAKVKTMDGTFNMGVQNANVNGVSGDYNITVPNTFGQWTDFDATFTTGPSPTSGVAFYNNCGSASGLIGYIDNWELYALPGIFTSNSELFFDEFSTSTSFKVTGSALGESILITTPAGLTVDLEVISANALNKVVTVTYDGTSAIEGDIVLTSGSYTTTISVTAYNNEECFVPLYQDAVNLISNPYLSDLTDFGGSGTKSISTNASINTNPQYSYCGVTSGKISGSGSIGKDLTGVLKPNTTYRVKAEVYRRNPGNVTYTYNYDRNNPTDYDLLITTAMDSACYYFNKYTPFEANISVYYSAGIPTAQATFYGSIGFGSNSRYSWVGTAIHEMDHYFGSGTSNEWWAKMVNGVWQGTAANTLVQTLTGDPGAKVYGDTQHFWPYGINQKEEITNLGNQAVQEQGLIDAVNVAKAMLVDDCGLVPESNPVGIGVYGWDGTSADIYHEATNFEQWQDIDFEFTTGATLGSTQGVYFSSGNGYIDNWEMYEVPMTTAVSEESIDDNYKVYLAGNEIISEIWLQRNSDIDIAVYDLNGKLLTKKQFSGIAGENREAVKAPAKSGLYIVKVVTNKQTISEKILK